MAVCKPGLAILLFLAGFSAQARAQGPAKGTSAGGYAPYPGPGSNGDYYAISPGFGSYGLPGSYPAYGGHALSGYGPGAQLNGYFTPGSKDGTQQTYYRKAVEAKPAPKKPAAKAAPPKGATRQRKGL